MSTMHLASMKTVSSAAAFRSARSHGTARPSFFCRNRLPQVQRRMPLVVYAEPEIDIEKAVKDAEKTCEANENAAECATAWDTVEELSAAQAHKKDQAVSDPLEQYCEEEPDADECRVYED